MNEPIFVIRVNMIHFTVEDVLDAVKKIKKIHPLAVVRIEMDYGVEN